MGSQPLVFPVLTWMGRLQEIRKEQCPQLDERPALRLPISEPPPGWEPEPEPPEPEPSRVIIIDL